MLARVAERVRSDDLDGGAQAIDAALAEIEAGYRRSQTTLLEEGIKVDTLRRDAAAVARRIEMLVAVDHPTDRPAWLPEFRARLDAFIADGETQGINFSLSVAIELARRMVATARDDGERWTATVLLGTALWSLGERESGTARLEEAVAAFRAALKEWTRERVPLDWATTQNDLGIALWRLGERESGTARLEEAVAAYRAGADGTDARARAARLGNDAEQSRHRAESARRARERHGAAGGGGRRLSRGADRRWTRERVPLQWATTQNNLGIALSSLGERESGTARLEEAVAAYHQALTEWTRERVPFQWALTQENLAVVFDILCDPRSQRDATEIFDGGFDGRGRRARGVPRGQRRVLRREGGTAARKDHGRAGGGPGALSGGAPPAGTRLPLSRIAHSPSP